MIYDLQVGGVQRMLLRMLPRLRERGIMAHVACLKFEGELAPQFRDAGIPVHLVPFRSRLDPAGLWALRRLVAREKFDIAHGHMYASNMALNVATLGMGRPGIVNGYHSETPWRGNGQRRLMRLMRNVPASYVAVSGAVQKPLLELGIAKKKIHVIPNGVEIPAGPPLPEIPTEPRAIRLFWGGRFVGQKRVGMLVDIAERLYKEDVPFHMTLAGEGPEFGRIKQRVADAGLSRCVHFPGWQNDIRPSIRDADLYISASNREGLPNTLLEVCSQARGFLVSDIAPNREVLGESRAGLCLGDDLSAWVAEIRTHQQNPALVRERGQAAHERVKAFSVENTCALTVGMYEGILGKDN